MVARAILVFVLLLGASAAAREGSGGWTTYVNERFGFSLRYPADVFISDRQSAAGDGEVFSVVQGEGRLLVGALENNNGYTVAEYMDLLRRQSYARFTVTYARRSASWFVVSGDDGRDVFYEKVMFSCGGRLINSFSLLYPTASKLRFDPIVERIENTFRAGQCDRRHAAG